MHQESPVDFSVPNASTFAFVTSALTVCEQLTDDVQAFRIQYILPAPDQSVNPGYTLFPAIVGIDMHVSMSWVLNLYR